MRNAGSSEELSDGLPPGVAGEARVIEASVHPGTAKGLSRDLRSLGVGEGMTLLVHSSMSALGWVAGGPQAAIEALLTAVGDEGTLVMPTHTTGLSEPSLWRNPPVPESWWPVIRGETPAFDPALTPSRMMGVIAEGFRTHPGVRRSGHPQVSFAACGPNAAVVVDDHSLDHGLGDGSPLGRLYDVGGYVLLLGVGHVNNTTLHLAEYRADYPGKEWVTQGAPILVDGERRWVTFDELEGNSDDFEPIGEAFAAAGFERRGPVGSGEGRLMAVRALVDFAVDWMAVHRTET
jgi:aminoglycoside 3-N-acetyltransferase